MKKSQSFSFEHFQFLEVKFFYKFEWACFRYGFVACDLSVMVCLLFLSGSLVGYVL